MEGVKEENTQEANDTDIHVPQNLEAVACHKCNDILSRDLEAINRFPQPELQAEMLHHFRHHDPSMPMDPEFCRFAGLMSDAVERRTQSMGSIACRNCTDIFLRVLEAIDCFPQPELQAEMLHHFHHHDPSIPIHAEFRRFAGLMADAVEQQTWSVIQNYLTDLNDLSMVNNDVDMEGSFQLDDHALDQDANRTGQERDDSEPLSAVLGPDDSQSQVDHWYTHAAELAAKPSQKYNAFEGSVGDASIPELSEISNISVPNLREVINKVVDT
jgi:hypothetical protein